MKLKVVLPRGAGSVGCLMFDAGMAWHGTAISADSVVIESLQSDLQVMSELSDLRTVVETTCDAVADQAKGNTKVTVTESNGVKN